MENNPFLKTCEKHNTKKDNFFCRDCPGEEETEISSSSSLFTKILFISLYVFFFCPNAADILVQFFST